MNKPTEDEINAATKMQALHRGRQVRKEKDEQIDAAKKIQKLHRKKKKGKAMSTGHHHNMNKHNHHHHHDNENNNNNNNNKSVESKNNSKNNIKKSVNRLPEEVLASLNHSNILESPRVPSWLLQDAEKQKKIMSNYTKSSKRNFLKSLRKKGIKTQRLNIHSNENESKMFWNNTWPELERKGWKRDRNGNFLPPPTKNNDKDKNKKKKTTAEKSNSSKQQNVNNKKISVVAKRSKNRFLNIKYQGLATKQNRVIHSVDWMVAIPLKKHSVLKDKNDKDHSYKLKCQVYLYNELDGILMIRLPSGRTSHLSIGLDDFKLLGTKIGRRKDEIYRRLRKRLIGYERLQHRCAAKIQSVFRFFNIRSQTEPKLKALRLERKRLRSTIKIQSAYKGYVTRKTFKKEISKLREERERRRQERIEQQKKRAARRKRYYAATKIQARARGVNERKSYASFKEKKINAANMITHNYRGYIYRKHIQAGGIDALLKHVKKQKQSAKKAKKKHRKHMAKLKKAASKVEKKLEFEKEEEDEKEEGKSSGKKEKSKSVASKKKKGMKDDDDDDDKRFDEEEVEFVPPPLPKEEKEEDDEDNDKKVSEEGAQGDGKRVTFESDDEEDKEWLAIQERRKQEVIKETRRENATYIPVQEIDKVDRLAVEKKQEVLQEMSLTTTLLAYETICDLSVLVPNGLAKMIPKKYQKKPSTKKCLQALSQGLNGMKQVTLSTRIYVGRNMARFVILVPARKKEKKVINILVSASEDPGEDEVRYVYIVDGNDFVSADDKELSRQYVTLQHDILDFKRKNDNWVRWAKYLAAICSRYGLSNAENQKIVTPSPAKKPKQQQQQQPPPFQDAYSRRIALRSPVTAEMKVKKRRGTMGLSKQATWYPDEYTLDNRLMNIDYTVTKHKTLLEKVKDWPTANATIFLQLLHKLREKLQHSDEHLLNAVEKKIFEDRLMITPEEEERRKHEVIQEWIDDLLDDVVEEVLKSENGDDEKKSDTLNDKKKKKKPSKTLSQKQLIEQKFKEFGTDTRKKLEQIFKLFDKTGTGMVNIDEFKSVLKLFMEEIDEKFGNYFIAYFDENGDGKIEFEEFADVVLETNPQDSLTLNYQPLLLSYALKYGEKCLSNIEVFQFGPCPPLKCAWHPPENCRVFEDIVVMNPPTQSAKKHLKLRNNLSKKRREFLMKSCMSIEWMVSVYTYGDSGKKEWKLARATGYEGYTRTLFVEQIGHFDMGVIRDLKYKRKVLAGEKALGCVCGECLLIREQLESGRIRLVRPLNRSSVKLFDRLYKLYVTDEMIDAYSRKAKPPALDGEMKSGDESDDDVEEEDEDLEDDEEEAEDDGLGFPIIEKLEIRWKALKHGKPGEVSKHILLTYYEVRKMHKNELGYFVSGYDINAGSNPPTLHFHLGDSSDSKIHAGLQIMERRTDDPAPPKIYENVMHEFKYVYESSEDDFESTDSEEYRVEGEEGEEEEDGEESMDEEDDDEEESKESNDKEETKDEEIMNDNKNVKKQGTEEEEAGEEKKVEEEDKQKKQEEEVDDTMKVKDKEIPKISNNGLPPLSLTKKKKPLAPINVNKKEIETATESVEADQLEEKVNKSAENKNIPLDPIKGGNKDAKKEEEEKEEAEGDNTGEEEEEDEEEEEEEDEDLGNEDFIKIKWRIRLLSYEKRKPFEAIAFELDDEDGVDIIAVKIDGEVVDIKLDDGSKVELLEDLIDDDSEGSKEFKELKAFLEEEGLETVKEEDEEDVVADDEQKGGDRKNEPVEENTGVHDAIDTIKEEDLEDLEEETA